VSLRGYQAELARLVAEPGFRERVRARGGTALGGGLTRRERARLLEIAGQPGLAVTATLIESFRLGKVLQSLPLTRTLLGERQLAREVRAFWRSHPPVSFYAADEVGAFCKHLLRPDAAPRDSLADVVGLERALLELRRLRPDGRPAAPQRIPFRCDPSWLLPPLLAGRRPTGRRSMPCLVLAEREAGGGIKWLVAARRRRMTRPAAPPTREDPCPAS